MIDMVNMGMLTRMLQSEQGITLLRNVGNNPKYDAMLLKACGVKNPSPNDIRDLGEFAKGYFTTVESAATDAEKDFYKTAAEKSKHIEDALHIPTHEKIITGIGRAVSEGAKAAGNISVTNANRLAEALLAASRTNSARQTELYGPSTKEKLAEAYAKNKIRKGENVKHVTDAASNLIDKLLGDYQAEKSAERNMKAAPYLQGVPGDLFAYMNGMQSRQYKHDKSLGL